jgi:hypothetical protein
MLYRCNECKYLTDVKCNLKVHIVRKHSSQKPGENAEAPNSVIIAQNSVIPASNSVISASESPRSVQNSLINIETAIVTKKIFKCTKCDKNLTRQSLLVKHEEKCNGPIHPFECTMCRRIFNSKSTKFRHMKICEPKALVAVNTSATNNTVPQTISTLNNNGTINNNQNNINNSHNTTHNTNIIIAFKPENGDMIEFITKHITNPELKQIIAPIKNGEKCTPEMVETYTRHLLTNPENRCIEKTNLRSIHSKVHMGDNKWQTKHDKDALPYYACSVANNMDQTIKERLSDDKKLIDSATLKAIEKYLDYMSDKGYCNNADLAKEMQQDFYEITHRLKAVIYDTRDDGAVALQE